MSSNFHLFSATVEKRFAALSADELFVVDLDGEDLFERYLAAFPDGTNPIFRVRTEHDCACCKQFIRNLGRVVAIRDGVLHTVWDDNALLPEPYATVAMAMSDYIRSRPIRTVFRTKEGKFGNAHTIELNQGVTTRWNHFVGEINKRHKASAPDTARSEIDSVAQVLRRGLDELTPGAFDTVLDLIDANALYRGTEFRAPLVAFRDLQRSYPLNDAAAQNVYVWSNVNNPAARFRNTVIGTLVTDLSAGEELESAVRKFESKVAPTNYKRPTALITPKMIDDAMETLKGLGLEGAVERRFARLSDVSVNNVLFVDNSVQNRMRDGLAGLLMDEVRQATPDLKGAENISADDFFTRILPEATNLKVLVENRHFGNFVSLTAPVQEGPGRLFRWHNDFAWSYDGEVTDSIKQRVKAAGGKVDAPYRVSLAWSNFDDLDLHVYEPDGCHINFSNRRSFATGGQLDIDMNVSATTRNAVENIFWTKKMPDGDYRVGVHNFTKRENIDVGFSLEVEFNGSLHQFSHAAAVPSRVEVKALVLTVKGGQLTGIKAGPGMVGGTSSMEKWGVQTETLVPVDTLMASPNYWDGREIGNKHWFFILNGCKNPDATRGIYNEFLRAEFDKHRKVFEVLGAKTKCPPADEQLSGVGFSSTRGDTVTVVVNGRKAYNIKF